MAFSAAARDYTCNLRQAQIRHLAARYTLSKLGPVKYSAISFKPSLQASMRRVRYYFVKSECSFLGPDSYAFSLPLESISELVEGFRAQEIISASAHILCWTGTFWASLQTITSPNQLPDTDPIIFKILRSGELMPLHLLVMKPALLCHTAAKQLAEEATIGHAWNLPEFHLYSVAGI